MEGSALASAMASLAALELKILYGKDITAFNFFQKLNVYVSASISSDDPDKKLQRAQQQRTPPDKEGDGTPEWRHELRFDLDGIDFKDSDDVFLRLDLFHEGVMFGDKLIGEVHVPLRDLADQPPGVARIVSYQAKGVDGKPNGVLTFSYKVVGAGDAPGIWPADLIDGVPNYVISHHHQGINQESPQSQSQPPPVAFGDSSPVSNLYPVLSEESTTAPSAPPLDVQYPPSSRPDTLYPPPPVPDTFYPPPSDGYYPHHVAPPMYPGSPRSPPAHGPGYYEYYHHRPHMRPLPPHMHRHHHHHHSWSHDHRPYMGGGGNGWGDREAWRGTSWNGR